jgi:ATP-dependent DNA helicase RecG
MTEKCDPPHTMVMSATPIPRTLGVIFYGDLDISLVDELPKTRLPIKNAVVDNTFRQKAMRFFAGQLKEGRQIYVICPMIEENESIEAANVTDTAAALRKEFPGVEVGKLHGRMKAEEKDRIMEKFLNGTIRILVSTTVVEVGVDVPNATVMMIEDADRFGLSQMHQLRGRVGRSGYQSHCILLTEHPTDDARERMRLMSSIDDGFALAQKDLELRGPGDFFGNMQHGLPPMKTASLTDASLLHDVQEAAESIIQKDPLLESEEHRAIKFDILRLFEQNSENGMN